MERLGDTGRKIHTGRSRNDQVLVATRLYLRSALRRLRLSTVEIARTALQRAHTDAALPMPGYTHLQRAMVSSAGLWWAGWAETFIDDAQRAVSGEIRMIMHAGKATPTGRRSDLSLYDFNLATYDEGDAFDQSSARGFIDIYGLAAKQAAARDVAFGNGENLDVEDAE